MPNILLFVLGLIAGIVIPIQTALNAQLGKVTGHPLLTTMGIFIVGGTVCLLVLLIIRPEIPRPTILLHTPIWSWFGGFVSVLYIVLLVFLAPRLGVGTVTVLVLAGQLLSAVAIDHFGVLGASVHRLDFVRVSGLLLISKQ